MSARLAGVLGWLLLVLGIGWVDILSGPDYEFGLFYLLAVAPAVWFHGRTVGVLVAVTAGLASFIADTAVRAEPPIAPVAWNALSSTCLFVAAALVTDRLRDDRARLVVLSGHDPLTGLFNRHFLQEHIGLLHAAADRYARPYAVIAIDADRLKALNDRHGHPAGDAALVAFARDLSNIVRNSDVVARTGGDEFFVLMPDASAAQATILAERIMAMVRQNAGLQGHRLKSVSVGVAEWTPGVSTDEILEKADRLLYASKRAARTG